MTWDSPIEYGVYPRVGGGTSLQSWDRPYLSPTVYPRVGGGTLAGITDPSEPYGLSPRGRGNRIGQTPNAQRHRSIPAWTGEPRCWTSSGSRPRVYPRVGGGTTTILKVELPTKGSIPAWAGEPPALLALIALAGVYPRVGGGTSPAPCWHPTGLGLSPRGRGNRIRHCANRR